MVTLSILGAAVALLIASTAVAAGGTGYELATDTDGDSTAPSGEKEASDMIRVGARSDASNLYLYVKVKTDDGLKPADPVGAPTAAGSVPNQVSYAVGFDSQAGGYCVSIAPDWQGGTTWNKNNVYTGACDDTPLVSGGAGPNGITYTPVWECDELKIRLTWSELGFATKPATVFDFAFRTSDDNLATVNFDTIPGYPDYPTSQNGEMYPAPPTGLTATSQDNRVALSWTNVDNGAQPVQRYHVYYATTSGGPYTLLDTTTSTSYVHSITPPAAGQQQYYAVKSENCQGESQSFSSEASVLHKVTPNPVVLSIPPVDVTGSEINLTWTNPSPRDNVGVTGFRVYRGTTGFTPDGTNLVADGVDATATSYKDTGLSMVTEYCYVVRAYDAYGNDGDLSNEACATTKDTAPPTWPDDALTAHDPTQTTIDFTWAAASDAEGAVASYDIFCHTDPGVDPDGGAFSFTEAGVESTYRLSGLTPSTTYYCVVRAYDEAGNPADSNEASATTLDDIDEDPPSWPADALTATATSENTIDLDWTAADDNEAVTSYNVYCSTTQGFTPDDATNLVAPDLDPSTISYELTGLQPWTDHYCIVRAFDGAENQADSNEATAKTWDVTPPSKVTDLDAGNPTTSTIRLTWTAPSDNVAVTGHEVYCDTSAGFTPGPANLVADDVGASATSYQVTGLDPDTFYFCVIRAYDEAGNQAEFSGIASEKTTSDQPESGIPDPSISTLEASPDQIDVDTGASTVMLTLYDTNGDPITDTYTAVDVAAGAAHACALLEDGSVRCWGNNDWGQLGDGGTTGRAAPHAVAGITDAVAIGAGIGHSCALLADATVQCWGDNGVGQLGGGTTGGQSLEPTTVSGLTGVVAIGVGAGHSCAVLADGSVWCWGHNSGGQLGDGTTVDQATPVQVADLPDGVDAVSVAADFDHTCAILLDNTAYCWGENDYGELGDGTTTDRSTAVRATDRDDLVSIVPGLWHTCAATAAGDVYCWGDNGDGQLGDGTTIASTAPVQASGLTDVAALSARNMHTCALLTTGTVHCWGVNVFGQLGDGTTTDSPTPVEVVGLAGVSRIAAGAYHSCAAGVDGRVHCWGYNSDGQLGDGTTDDSSPRQVEHLYASIGISTEFGTLDPVRPTDNGDGTYTTTFTCSAADTATLAATIDGEDVDDQATVECVVPDDNTPPEANDDPDYTTPFETALSVSEEEGVLDNDTDADGDTLTTYVVTGPTKASSFTLNTNGSFDYTPASGETGVDTFTYRVEDGNGGSDQAMATITIGSGAGGDPPVADDQDVEVEEDSAVLITLTATDNETGVTFSLSGPAPEGLTGTPPELTYAPPADLCTPDDPVSFYFKAVDAGGQLDTGVVTIEVICKPDVPVAVDDAATVQGGRSVTIDVLANDRHPDAPYDTDATVMLDSVDAASAEGAAASVVDGKVVYEALDRFVPTYVDTFGYTIVDGDGQQVEGTVHVTVTPPPSQLRPPPSSGGGGGAPAAPTVKREVAPEPAPVPDTDRDGILDDEDNCVDDPNVDQADADADDVGDACDPDRDGDTVRNDDDNCPDTPNARQGDMDDDSIGDACDPDRDGDGLDQHLPGSSQLLDNCPDARNPLQKDADNDGIGDACDTHEEVLETAPSRRGPGAALQPSAPVAEARSVPVLAVGLGIVLMVAVGILVVTWTMKAAGRGR